MAQTSAPPDPATEPHIKPAELRDLALALVAALLVVGLLCFLHLASNLKGKAMRLIPVAGALALASLALCACSTTGNAEASAQLLQNLRHCARDYIGTLGGMAPPAASISVHCPAEPYAPAQPAEAPVT